MSEPRTIEEHASFLTKLVLNATAYGASRRNIVNQIQQYLEKNFHLTGVTNATPFRTKNPENLVRVHLDRAVLLGFGQKIKYTHTLVGERQPPLGEQHGNVNFVAVNVCGFMRGGKYFNLDRPALHLLANHNILSIESLEVEDLCCEEGQ